MAIFYFVLLCCLFPLLCFSIYDHVSQGCHLNLLPPDDGINGSCELQHLHQFSLKLQSHATAWPDFLVCTEEHTRELEEMTNLLLTCISQETYETASF